MQNIRSTGEYFDKFCETQGLSFGSFAFFDVAWLSKQSERYFDFAQKDNLSKCTHCLPLVATEMVICVVSNNNTAKVGITFMSNVFFTT